METSTTSSDIFTGNSTNSISSPNVSSDSNTNSKNWLYILIVLALFAFLYYILSNSAEAEHMSGGTLTQLFANDMQDTYLKGNVDQLATGNFLLHWNQPTRIASGYGFNNGVPNRGQLLSTIPQVSVNPSPVTNASPKDSISVNVPGILSPVDGTVFPRVNPKSTVNTYPGIKNILVNQKKDDELLDREVNQDLSLGLAPRTNTLRNDATNTLQNALVNSCQDCIPGKCQNCPMCLNGRTSYPKADSVASNKVDAKSIGNLEEESEYMPIENFDSGLSNQTMPSRVHNKIKKKIIRRQENFDSGLTSSNMPIKVYDNLNKMINKHAVFAKSVSDDDVENFDSGLSNQTMPTRVHNQIKKKIIRRQENFDSGLSSSNMPVKVHDNLNKMLNKHPVFAKNGDDDVENFDSGLSSQGMPTRVHNQIKKKIIRRQENFDSGLTSSNMPVKVHYNLNKMLNKHPVFAKNGDEDVETFDSGLSSQGMPTRIHNQLKKKIVRRQENFDSGISSSNMPTKVHNSIKKKLNKKENFDEDGDDDIIFFVNEVNDGNENMVRNPLRAGTGGCANCPQARCANCPKSKCGNFKNCALGYSCKSCDVQDYLNSRTTLDNNENFSNISNNQRENFDCPCRRKVISATNLNQRKLSNDLENFDSNGVPKKKGVKDFLNDSPVIDNRDLFKTGLDNRKEDFQCSLNPDSTECVGCVSMCPCRFGNCSECPACQQGNCQSCPNRRCPCLMGRCQDCPACKQGNCPMCPKKESQSVKENFESVGFETLCPCAGNRCNNCPLCRAGNCPNCPKVKPNSTFVDLASFANNSGGYRLAGDWNNPTTSPSSVDIGNGITFFPDSYVSQYFTNPKPDIMMPYHLIPPSRSVAGLVVDFGKK